MYAWLGLSDRFSDSRKSDAIDHFCLAQDLICCSEFCELVLAFVRVLVDDSIVSDFWLTDDCLRLLASLLFQWMHVLWLFRVESLVASSDNNRYWSGWFWYELKIGVVYRLNACRIHSLGWGKQCFWWGGGGQDWYFSEAMSWYLYWERLVSWCNCIEYLFEVCSWGGSIMNKLLLTCLDILMLFLLQLWLDWMRDIAPAPFIPCVVVGPQTLILSQLCLVWTQSCWRSLDRWRFIADAYGCCWWWLAGPDPPVAP